MAMSYMTPRLTGWWASKGMYIKWDKSGWILDTMGMDTMGMCEIAL